MAGYFAYIEPQESLGRTYRFLYQAVLDHERAGRPLEALRVRRVWERLMGDYERIGVEGARKADELIRGRIRSSAVRPPTSGRLERAVLSAPMASTLPGGGIRIASLDALDSGAVNPRGKGIYWRSQEYGLPVFPDQRPAPGYFMPGFSAPSGDAFRAHPYFQQMRYAKGMPALVRTVPLEARHFLRDGTEDVVRWWQVEARAAQRRALTGLTAR